MIKLVKYFGKNDILEFFEFNTGVVRLISLFLTVLIMVHLFGCLWHYLAALNYYDPNSWVYRNGLEHKSTFTLYIASIYYAFTALTTVGYGDIHAEEPGTSFLQRSRDHCHHRLDDCGSRILLIHYWPFGIGTGQYRL